MAGVTVKLQKCDIQAKGQVLGVKGATAVVAAVTDNLISMADPLVPFRTGALKNSARALSDYKNGIITYGGAGMARSYADAQYKTPMKHREGRRDHWLDAAMDEHSTALKLIAQAAAEEAVRL